MYARQVAQDALTVADPEAATTFWSGVDGVMQAQLDYGNGAANDLLGGGGLPSTRVDTFADSVYSEASARLQVYADNLGAWRTYAVGQLDDVVLRAQLYAARVFDLREAAYAQGQGDLYEAWLVTTDANLLGAYESVIDHDYGGCQACHTIVGADNLPDLTVPSPVAELAAASQLAPPTAWENVLPTAYAGPIDPAAVDALRNQDADAFAMAAVARIGLVLAPLGDAGYQVLPADLFSRLGTAPTDELRAELDDAIQARLDGFAELQGAIASRSVSWMEFQPVIADLLAVTNDPELSAEVESAVAQASLGAMLAAVTLTVLQMISIAVFPPSALVFGAINVAQGMVTIDQGSAIAGGTGAPEVVSPETAESGEVRVGLGFLQIFGGLVDMAAGASAIAGAGTSAASQADDLLLASGQSTIHRSGPCVWETLPDGRVMLRNLDQPRFVGFIEGARYTLYDDLGNGGLALLDEGTWDWTTMTATSTMSADAVTGLPTALAGVDVPTGLIPQLSAGGVDVAAMTPAVYAAIGPAEAAILAGDGPTALSTLAAAGLGTGQSARVATVLAIRSGWTIEATTAAFGDVSLTAPPHGVSPDPTSFVRGTPDWDAAAAVIQAFDPATDPAVVDMIRRYPWLAQARIVPDGNSLGFGPIRPASGPATLGQFMEIGVPDPTDARFPELRMPSYGGDLATEYAIAVTHELGHAVDAAAFLETYLQANYPGVWARLIAGGVDDAEIGTVFQILDAHRFGGLTWTVATPERQAQELAAWGYAMPSASAAYGDAANQAANGALGSYGLPPQYP